MGVWHVCLFRWRFICSLKGVRTVLGCGKSKFQSLPGGFRGTCHSNCELNTIQIWTILSFCSLFYSLFCSLCACLIKKNTKNPHFSINYNNAMNIFLYAFPTNQPPYFLHSQMKKTFRYTANWTTLSIFNLQTANHLLSHRAISKSLLIATP